MPGLAHAPVFAPAVGRYAQGMIVEVPLQLWALPGTPTPKQLREALADFYQGEQFVSVAARTRRPRCRRRAPARAAMSRRSIPRR